MTFWLALTCNIALLFVMNTVLLRVTKALRGKRGALNERINLDDVLVLSISSLFIGLACALLPWWLMCIILAFFACYGWLVWLDALLFIQYRIEINRQTLAWFFTGTKGLSKGIPHLFAGLKKLPFACAVPFLWLLILYLQGSQWLTQVIAILPIVALLSVATLFFACCALLVALVVMRALFQTQHPFLTSPSMLLNIFADDSFDLDQAVEIRPEHQKFMQPASAIPAPSILFGACAGANVILVTIESLGAYIAPYVQDAARSRIAERLAHKSWVSQQHFCLCPNTTVSTNQMYTGAYSNNPYNKSDSLFPGTEPKHIELLKQQGYKTLFLDSADIQLYDYHKLLTRIGFDKVWGTADIPAGNLPADYRILNMVDEIAEAVQDSPFYLHIINDQTHMPYQVVDKNRFNRHGFADDKSVYLNALEEVDHIIDTFLTKLADKCDLSNTILVFTGDHGESFGEYGYSFHSNSVIKPQMQVPFFLHHPNLAPKTLAHSCHFDLFPTFFDLLGIACPYPTIGNSLAQDDREFAYFFHSATLKGNSPANFGFMLDGDMVWMDRLFNQVNIIRQDQQRKTIDAQQKRYSKTLLHQMLKQRGVLA